MEPADLLAEELEQIYIMLDILEVMHARLQKGQTINIGDLKRIIHFFKVFAHKAHGKKEENIFFPLLKKYSQFQSSPIIEELMSENSLGEFYLETLKDAIEKYEKGDARAKDKMLGIMKKYLSLEKNHAQKEEIFFLPLCKREIPKQDYSSIFEAMKTHDNQQFGSNMHDKFHQAFAKVISKMKQHYFTSN